MLDIEQREILECEYLRRLFRRDAAVFAAHQKLHGEGFDDDDDDDEEAPDAEPTTVKALAIELILKIDHTDPDGRDIGIGYEIIMRELIRRFPTVTLPGRWFGRPLATSYKELHEIACGLRRKGVVVPSRPRRPKPKDPHND